MREDRCQPRSPTRPGHGHCPRSVGAGAQDPGFDCGRYLLEALSRNRSVRQLSGRGCGGDLGVALRANGLSQHNPCRSGIGVCLARSEPLGLHLRCHARLQPTDNAFIKPFNSKLRAKCLNAHWFMSFEDVRKKRRTGPKAEAVKYPQFCCITSVAYPARHRNWKPKTLASDEVTWGSGAGAEHKR